MIPKTDNRTSNGEGGSMELVLPLAHFRLQLQAQTPIHFHHYSGSAWRGLFGHALREVACVTGERDCRGCLLYRSCVYAYVFETPASPDGRFMRRADAVPHPFVLFPEFDLRHLKPGDCTSLDLILAGSAIERLPYIVHAMATAGERGVGAGEGRYQLVGVSQAARLGADQWCEVFGDDGLRPLPADCPVPPALPERVVMDFHSPLRLRYRGRMLSPEYFHFGGLIANLLRRYSMMSYFHAGQEVDLDFKGLVAQACEVDHRQADLRWYNWRRYSSRQSRAVSMGGVMGRVIYDANDIAPFWPLLWLGQWLHLGKGTSMGLGRYRVVQASGAAQIDAAA